MTMCPQINSEIKDANENERKSYGVKNFGGGEAEGRKRRIGGKEATERSRMLINDPRLL